MGVLRMAAIYCPHYIYYHYHSSWKLLHSIIQYSNIYHLKGTINYQIIEYFIFPFYISKYIFFILFIKQKDLIWKNNLGFILCIYAGILLSLF